LLLFLFCFFCLFVCSCFFLNKFFLKQKYGKFQESFERFRIEIFNHFNLGAEEGREV
jgi:hypothetical protein